MVPSSLRRFYQKHHYVRLPKFLNKKLLREILKALKKSKPFRYQDSGGSESMIGENAGSNTLQFLLNDPSLLKKIYRLVFKYFI